MESWLPARRWEPLEGGPEEPRPVAQAGAAWKASHGILVHAMGIAGGDHAVTWPILLGIGYVWLTVGMDAATRHPNGDGGVQKHTTPMSNETCAGAQMMVGNPVPSTEQGRRRRLADGGPFGKVVDVGGGEQAADGRDGENSAQGLTKHFGLRWAREENPDDATPRATCQAPVHCAPREAS